MGMRPQFDWNSIKALFINGKSARELAIAFGCSDSAIEQKSAKEGWMALRKKAREMQTPDPFDVLPSKNGRKGSKLDVTIGIRKGSDDSNVAPKTSAPIVSGDIAFSRAVKLRSSDTFRERVITQAGKALDTLEKAAVNNVFEADRFAEALTKVERIGARAYGYDKEGDHPVINIGILGSGSEYDPIS